MIKAIFCDWNKTVFEDEYDYVFFNGYAKREAARCLRVLNLLKFFSVIDAKSRCEKILCEHGIRDDRRNDDIERIVHILNERVIQGTPARLLERYTDRYAEDGVQRLDGRILDPLRAVRISKGIVLGLISSGYSGGIHRILRNAGYTFDFIRANDFEIRSRRVVEFKLDVFNNKDEILAKFLAEQGIKDSDVVYIGDDGQDECCLRMVGYPVVSFMACEEYKERFHKEFQAFVPKDREDFANYIYDLV